MTLHLARALNLTDASTLKTVRVAPGCYPLLLVDHPWRPGGAPWGVLGDTSIGAALGWLQAFALEHPEWLRLGR